MRTHRTRRALLLLAALVAGVSGLLIAASPAGAKTHAFITTLKAPVKVGSTVPANGDVNPYGIAVVTHKCRQVGGRRHAREQLQRQGEHQGTGTTIAEVSPHGALTQFAQIPAVPASGACPGGIGLTTALSILPGGWVVVGSLPAGAHGALPSVNPAGCLLVLNSSGQPVATWTTPDINGPWDMTASSRGRRRRSSSRTPCSRPASSANDVHLGALHHRAHRRVSCARMGAPQMTGSTVVGTGSSGANKAAFVQSPTGLVLESLGHAVCRRDSRQQHHRHSRCPHPDLSGHRGHTLHHHGQGIPQRSARHDDGTESETSSPPTATTAIWSRSLRQGHQVAKATLVHDGAGDLFGTHGDTGPPHVGVRQRRHQLLDEATVGT